MNPCLNELAQGLIVERSLHFEFDHPLQFADVLQVELHQNEVQDMF